MSYRSPLGRLVTSAANDAELEQLKRRAWREESILVVRMDDERIGQFQKDLLQLVGEKLYGRNSDR